MSFFAPLIGAAVSGAANFGLSKLFGGEKGEAQSGLSTFQPAGFSAGGLTTGFDPATGRITLTPSAERLGYVRGVSEGFNAEADLFGGLRSRVAPGVSDLRRARLEEIENARVQAIGNLRENLSRRRVLGSSFGQDAATRAEAEFAGARERVSAESFLQELEMSNQLIQQEFASRRASFQTGLDELNLQADLAAKLSGAATQQLGANARALAELNAKEAAGSGKFFGEITQPFTAALGKAAGSMFSFW